MTLDQFETLARSRRATRHFRPDPLPPGMVERLLDVARWAPSGYNLQPTHFTAVDDPALKPALRHACMDQAQVTEAPVTVVLSGDRRVVQAQAERMLSTDRDAGAIDARYEAQLRKVLPLAFGQGPCGVGWAWKTAGPLMSYAMPVPSIPAVFKRFWVTKQVMLCAMNLMLAATAAGLATVPMEGFDERRVKRLLGIPRWHVVPIVIPLGYATDQKLTKTRLPLEQFVHRNRWGE